MFTQFYVIVLVVILCKVYVVLCDLWSILPLEHLDMCSLPSDMADQKRKNQEVILQQFNKLRQVTFDISIVYTT